MKETFKSWGEVYRWTIQKGMKLNEPTRINLKKVVTKEIALHGSCPLSVVDEAVSHKGVGIHRYNNLKMSRPLFLVDALGNILKEFKSVMQACRELDISRQFLYEHLRGKRANVEGYYFKDKEEGRPMKWKE